MGTVQVKHRSKDEQKNILKIQYKIMTLNRLFICSLVVCQVLATNFKTKYTSDFEERKKSMETAADWIIKGARNLKSFLNFISDVDERSVENAYQAATDMDGNFQSAQNFMVDRVRISDSKRLSLLNEETQNNLALKACKASLSEAIKKEEVDKKLYFESQSYSNSMRKKRRSAFKLLMESRRQLFRIDWCAKIYEHANYRGWEKVIQETSRLELTNKNDQTSSVRIKPGCTLKLFKHYNSPGLLDSLTAGVWFLSAYNDQVSRLSCTCRGHLNSARKNYLQAKKSWADAIKLTKNRQSLYENAVDMKKKWQHKISDLAEKVEELREVYKLTISDLRKAVGTIGDLAVSSKVLKRIAQDQYEQVLKIRKSTIWNSSNLDEKMKEQLVNTMLNFEVMAKSTLAVGESLEEVVKFSGWESNKVLEIAKKVKIMANEVIVPLKEMRKTHNDVLSIEYDYNG